ncbi:hypothetical protein MZM54_04335 [[Brevibacterium] frigoritolerans]|nr:hypothetical protein [Peribacillus frigoritolerans]
MSGVSKLIMIDFDTKGVFAGFKLMKDNSEASVVFLSKEYEEVKQFVMEESTKEELHFVDCFNLCSVFLKEGEIKSWSTEYGLNDDWFRKEWLGQEKAEEKDEVSCTSCGDGGCFNCEARRFI